MITMSNFGNNGRLANQLFQYASMIGIASKNGHQLRLPKWKYAEYFEQEFPEGVEYGTLIREKQFHYSDIELKDGSFDLHGYFQSEKYWNKEGVLKALSFKQSFKDRVKDGYDFTKPVIAVHIRRGDYVGHDCYLQLPITYFYQALEEWKDWRECNIIIFSDDIPYCRVHFQCLENVQFASGNEIEDICLMSQCQRFVLSNSSYSWWGAYLSESKEVIRPNGLFRGEYAKKNNDKDFWPEEWKILSPQKPDLKDVTFTIPVYFDHPDRKLNLSLSVCLIQHYLDTNVMVMENRHTEFKYMDHHCRYEQSNYRVFHRTKMLNDMANLASTNIIFNWDADVFIPPIQILECVRKLRSGIEMVFPYDGRFARFDRRDWFGRLKESLDIGIVGDQQFKGMEPGAKVSLGGAIGYLKNEYFKIGGENERFISFGAEDQERVIRAKKLGLRVERVKGVMYHMSHWTGVNSTTANPYFYQNKQEFTRVEEMEVEELKMYVAGWK